MPCESCLKPVLCTDAQPDEDFQDSWVDYYYLCCDPGCQLWAVEQKIIVFLYE